MQISRQEQIDSSGFPRCTHQFRAFERGINHSLTNSRQTSKTNVTRFGILQRSQTKETNTLIANCSLAFTTLFWGKKKNKFSETKNKKRIFFENLFLSSVQVEMFGANATRRELADLRRASNCGCVGAVFDVCIIFFRRAQ
jgi:hypothetical protein